MRHRTSTRPVGVTAVAVLRRLKVHGVTRAPGVSPTRLAVSHLALRHKAGFSNRLLGQTIAAEAFSPQLQATRSRRTDVVRHAVHALTARFQALCKRHGNHLVNGRLLSGVAADDLAVVLDGGPAVAALRLVGDEVRHQTNSSISSSSSRLTRARLAISKSSGHLTPITRASVACVALMTANSVTVPRAEPWLR